MVHPCEWFHLPLFIHGMGRVADCSVQENWMTPDFFGVSPLDQYNVSDEVRIWNLTSEPH